MSATEEMVSVITVTYNSEKTLARTIEAVLAQTYPRIEYLIIDGDSTDGTVALAERYKERFEQKGYLYRIVSEPDKGMYDALNKGVQLAQGKYIGQINSDDWYEPIAVESAVRTFERTGCEMCWGDSRIHFPNRTMVKKGNVRRATSSRFWNHPASFLRADIYKANPYALISMYDDHELVLRLYRKGCRMADIHEVIANFSLGGMSTQKDWSQTCRRIGYKCRNYRKNGFGWPYYLDSVLVEIAKYILA